MGKGLTGGTGDRDRVDAPLQFSFFKRGGGGGIRPSVHPE